VLWSWRERTLRIASQKLSVLASTSRLWNTPAFCFPIQHQWHYQRTRGTQESPESQQQWFVVAPILFTKCFATEYFAAEYFATEYFDNGSGEIFLYVHRFWSLEWKVQAKSCCNMQQNVWCSYKLWPGIHFFFDIGKITCKVPESERMRQKSCCLRPKWDWKL